MLVGLDRQEKGKGDISARQEIEEAFNMKVVSIINLDTLISYSASSPEHGQYFDKLKAYRDEWGA